MPNFRWYSIQSCAQVVRCHNQSSSFKVYKKLQNWQIPQKFSKRIVFFMIPGLVIQCSIKKIQKTETSCYNMYTLYGYIIDKSGKSDLQNHNSQRLACCEEEQEQGANAANPDGLGHGGDGGGDCGDDGGGDYDGRDCCPGGLSVVDYKVEELDLVNVYCLHCSVNAEDKKTD
uniref:Uncharacterized protein n=1 Tax=Oryza brachyantha TaxID=4533 RepID=J3LNS3_ORYBR